MVDATARTLGLVQVLWSTDSADSLGANYAGIVLTGLRPGAIILMHENRGQTIRALKFLIIPRLRGRHLRLVTVPQLLTVDPPSAAQLAQGARGCGAASPSRASGQSGAAIEEQAVRRAPEEPVTVPPRRRVALRRRDH